MKKVSNLPDTLPANIVQPRNYHRDKYQMGRAPPCSPDCFRSFVSYVFLEVMSFLSSLASDRTAVKQWKYWLFDG